MTPGGGLPAPMLVRHFERHGLDWQLKAGAARLEAALAATTQVEVRALLATLLGRARLAATDLEAKDVEHAAWALLDMGVAPGRLYVIEREPALCDVLRRRFPGVTVMEGDAAHLQQEALGTGKGAKAGEVLQDGLEIVPVP